MKVTFSNRFSKQLDAIKNRSLLLKISKTVETVISADDIRNIPDLKKLKGHPFAYRIKLGDYRIGLFIEKDDVFFAMVGHRKDIYNKFP